MNVGINVTGAARATLELNGSVNSTSGIFGGHTTGISVQSNWPGIGFNQYSNQGYKYMSDGYAAFQYLDPNTGVLSLDMIGYGQADLPATSVQRAFTIAANGNMGIRSNAFSSSLFVPTGGNYDGAAVFGGSAYNSLFNNGPDEHTYIRAGNAGGRVFLNDIPAGNTIFGSGNSMVGINTGAPTYTLEIRQAGLKGFILIDPDFFFNTWAYSVDQYASAPNSYLMLVYNGTLIGFFQSNGTYTLFSDQRIKSNIHSLPPVLDKLKQLNPVKYEMKDHNKKQEVTVGFIAQEVKAVFPELVTVQPVKVDSLNRVADLHALSQTGFSVIGIKAVQEQYRQILDLQKEQEELLKRVDDLTYKISKTL
jgi:Chaperone of endosialidase